MKVTARTKDKPTPVEVEYDFGDGTLSGLVKRFGEDVVYSRAMSALVIDLQALMRRHIESKDYTLEKLQKAVAEWKPTVVTAIRRTASERIEDTVSKMTPEQRAELLKKLMNPQPAAAKPADAKPATQTAGAKKAA